MISAADKDALRRLMRRMYQQHGCAEFISAMFEIGRELDREPHQVGPPSLADIVHLDTYRRRRWRDRPDPTSAA